MVSSFFIFFIFIINYFIINYFIILFLIILIIITNSYQFLLYFNSTTSDYTLRATPILSTEYETQAESLILSPFTGDPSFMAYNGAEPEEPVDPDDPDAPPPKEIFREVHRVSYTIQQIDHDCSIIPRGSLVVDATKKVIFNNYYTGLSYHTSAELRAYYHFRYPENPQGIAAMKKPGIIKADFLDCITKDVPTGFFYLILLIIFNIHLIIIYFIFINFRNVDCFSKFFWNSLLSKKSLLGRI